MSVQYNKVLVIKNMENRNLIHLPRDVIRAIKTNADVLDIGL